MFEGKKYELNEYLYLIKFFQKTERYQEMVKALNKYIEQNPKLSLEEQSLLCDGYKNIISDKRKSLQLLENYLMKEEKKEEITNYKKQINIVKEKIKNEFSKIFNDNILILDKYLIPNSQNYESKVLYIKLKADYYRYHCEFAEGDNFEESKNKAENLYKEAYKIALEYISVYNPIRLGLALNYSIFVYEVLDNKNEGYNIAQKAYDEAMSVVDSAEKKRSSDTLLIIQLLKENLNMWSNEMEGY